MVAPRTSGRTPSSGARPGRSAGPLRLAAWLLIALVVAVLGVLALSVLPVLRVRQQLADGREALQQARSAVVSGDARRALQRFGAAASSFDGADTETSGGVLRVAAHLPAIGANFDVMRALATAGSETARAGIAIARSVEALPGGIEALSPGHGRIPLERFPPLARAVGEARTLVGTAAAEVRSAPGGSLVLPSVDDARWEAQTLLDDLDHTLGSAAVVLDRLPEFLGAHGPRTYLFGADNPAELRGTGGLIGAYGLLRADDGRLSFSSFRPVQSLPLLDPDSLPAPNPDYRRLYDPQRSGDGFWLNVNMTPDFPSAARAFETAFQAATGQRLDGVITADPFALRALLSAVGSARVPGLGVTVTQDNVVRFLANEAYARFHKPAKRKLVLGAVAGTIVKRFLAAGGGANTVRTLARVAGEGHVLIYSNDPLAQAGFGQTGAGGAFAVPGEGTDLLSVVVNNGAGNKVDYYVDRDVHYTATLRANGIVDANASVALTNHAPTGGPPAYVIGPNEGVTTQPGQDISILNVYCGRCELSSAVRDGSSFDPGQDHELGSNFFQDYFTTNAGATTTTTLGYRSTGGWSGDAGGGTYTLQFLGQPTLRPTTVSIVVHVPRGMHVTQASAGVRVSGETASWTGIPGRSLTIRLAFAPSLAERLWRAVIN